MLWHFFKLFFDFFAVLQGYPCLTGSSKTLVGLDKWRLLGPSKHLKLKWWSWWSVMSARMLTLSESEQFLVSRAPNFSVCPSLSPCFCLSFNLSLTLTSSHSALSHTSKNCYPLIQVSVLTWAKSVCIHKSKMCNTWNFALNYMHYVCMIQGAIFYPVFLFLSCLISLKMNIGNEHLVTLPLSQGHALYSVSWNFQRSCNVKILIHI